MKNKKYLKIKYYLWYNPSEKTLYKPIQEKSGNNDSNFENALFIRISRVLLPEMATFWQQYITKAD